MLEKPPRLYELCAEAVADNFQIFRPSLDFHSKSIIFDIFYKIYERDEEGLLAEELKNFDTITKLLEVGDKRTLKLGENLGRFLCEAGWYQAGIAVQVTIVDLLRGANKNQPNYPLRDLECWSELLHSKSCYHQFKDAEVIYQELINFLEELRVARTENINQAVIYNEMSFYNFMRGEYDKSYQWSMKAVVLLSETLPAKVTIDVLRQTSKACTIKREFGKAEKLIKEAVHRAMEIYGERSPKYADCLLDYCFYFEKFGLFLKKRDCIQSCLQVSHNALDVRIECFGINNIQTAIAYGQMARISKGNFGKALAENCLETLFDLLPNDHSLLASPMLIYANTITGIADYSEDIVMQQKLLEYAEKLSLDALQLATDGFGEGSLKTAEYYTRLGALYLRMERPAEKLLLKGVKILEDRLWTESREMLDALRPLGTMYNDIMNEYKKAEEMYLRCRSIAMKLTGPGDAVLEDIYGELIRVYENLNNWARRDEFATALVGWRVLREEQAADLVEEVEEHAGDQAEDVEEQAADNDEEVEEQAVNQGKEVQEVALDRESDLSLSELIQMVVHE